MSHIALRLFTFSNGVTVPMGPIVSVSASSTHTDERIYSNPDKFNGFCFVEFCEIEEDTTATSKYQSVSLSSEYLVYGLGQHIW